MIMCFSTIKVTIQKMFSSFQMHILFTWLKVPFPVLYYDMILSPVINGVYLYSVLKVEQLIAIPEPVLLGILSKFKDDEEREVRTIRAR
jgi:hypothetical protein